MYSPLTSKTTTTTKFYTLSLHDALPIWSASVGKPGSQPPLCATTELFQCFRSEEHTSELQSRGQLVCRLLLEKKIHYLDTANYEPPGEAKFEYSWQWAYQDRFKDAD